MVSFIQILTYLEFSVWNIHISALIECYRDVLYKYYFNFSSLIYVDSCLFQKRSSVFEYFLLFSSLTIVAKVEVDLYQNMVDKLGEIRTQVETLVSVNISNTFYNCLI